MKMAQLQKSHIPDVVSLWEEANQTQNKLDSSALMPLTDEELRKFMDSENFLPDAAVLAKCGRQLVGFAYGYIDPDPPWTIDNFYAATGRLAGFAVHPSHWGQGIGRALLFAVEAVIRGIGDCCHFYKYTASRISTVAISSTC